MGGFGVAFFTGAILSYNGMKISYARLFTVFAIAAVAWEIFGYIDDVLLSKEWSGWFDTIKDLIDGFIGMSIAYLFIRK